MNFTFLHASDLHLGSPFMGLALKDEEVAKRFAAASRDAFAALVNQAIANKVAFIVLAGDIYDGEWRDTSIGLFFNREISRLHRAGISAYVLKGNHDAESVVTKSISLPDTVNEFPTKKPKTFQIPELKVALHGQSFPDRAVSENLALGYPSPLEGWFNIGVLHTACEGRLGHQSYAPCSVQDLKSKGYQYWALGHVHEFEIVAKDPWVVFPGNLQGRSVRECGPKGAVLVDVSDGHVSAVRRLFLDQARWADLSLDISEAEGETELLAVVQNGLRPVVGEAEGRLVAVRLRLTGRTALHEHLHANRARLADEVQAIGHHIHEDVWLERLVIETSAPSQQAGTGEGDLALDLKATLDQLEADEGFRASVTALFPPIENRLPPNTDAPTLAEEFDALLAEAKSTVLQRFARGRG